MLHCNDAVWLQQSGTILHTRNAIFLCFHDDVKVRILLNQMTAVLWEEIIMVINFTYLNPCDYFWGLFHRNLHIIQELQFIMWLEILYISPDILTKVHKTCFSICTQFISFRDIKLNTLRFKKPFSKMYEGCGSFILLCWLIMMLHQF
jgi:hypothetical protein